MKDEREGKKERNGGRWKEGGIIMKDEREERREPKRDRKKGDRRKMNKIKGTRNRKRWRKRER